MPAPESTTAYTNASHIVHLITKWAREIQLSVNTTFERKHVSLLLCRLRWMEVVNQPVVGSASIADRRVTPCSFMVGQLCPINNTTKDALYAINWRSNGSSSLQHTLYVTRKKLLTNTRLHNSFICLLKNYEIKIRLPIKTWT